MAEVGAGVAEIDSPSITPNGTEHVGPVDRVLGKFKEGHLLARVLQIPRITRGLDGPELEFGMWRHAAEGLTAEGGMEHLSTTLIMEGKQIPIYLSPIGLLFDSDSVQVLHVASSDSGSITTDTGELHTNQSDLKTLDELRGYYSNKVGTQEMNEVNINAGINSLVGLVIRKGVRSPYTFVEFEAVRKFLSDKGIVLPAYEYDERKGEMSRYVDPDKNKLLSELRPEYQQAYQNAI